MWLTRWARKNPCAPTFGFIVPSLRNVMKLKSKFQQCHDKLLQMPNPSMSNNPYYHIFHILGELERSYLIWDRNSWSKLLLSDKGCSPDTQDLMDEKERTLMKWFTGWLLFIDPFAILHKKAQWNFHYSLNKSFSTYAICLGLI